MMQQKTMYARDIEKVVDRVSGIGSYARVISNPANDIMAGLLIKAAKAPTWVSFATSTLLWMGGDLLGRTESWWKDSYIMVVRNEIRCVRVSHIRNTTSDYPAAYLIFERL